jgi:hypothetical protein
MLLSPPLYHLELQRNSHSKTCIYNYYSIELQGDKIGTTILLPMYDMLCHCQLFFILFLGALTFR